MKLLVFGDTHGLTDFSYLVSRSRDVDALVCVGDLTHFGRDVELVAAGLQSLLEASSKPVILTHGNHEAGSLREALEVHAPGVVYLHQDVHVLGDVVFFGYGGGGFARHDPRVEDFLRSAHELHAGSGLVVVWLFHGPPHGTGVDVVPGLGSTGCFSKRSLLDELRPHVVLAGHIHEQFSSVEEVGSSIVVNPGPDGLVVEVTYSKTNSTSTSSSGASR